MRVRDPFLDLYKSLRRQWLAHKFLKSPRAVSGGPILVVGDTKTVNGMSRAYRYELDRLNNLADSTASSDVVPTVVILGQPHSYHSLLRSPPERLGEAYRIGLWVTEFEVFPPDWRFALNIVHEIWTPSSFSARAIQSATDLPVKVVPHAVSVPSGPPLPRTRFGVRDDQFLGIAVMDLCFCPERKNPQAHVRAWKAAFGSDHEAHLLMKVRFIRKTQYMRRALEAEIGGSTNISLIEEVFSDEDISRFQRMANIGLSLHRSEG